MSENTLLNLLFPKGKLDYKVARVLMPKSEKIYNEKIRSHVFSIISETELPDEFMMDYAHQLHLEKVCEHNILPPNVILERPFVVSQSMYKNMDFDKYKIPLFETLMRENYNPEVYDRLAQCVENIITNWTGKYYKFVDDSKHTRPFYRYLFNQIRLNGHKFTKDYVWEQDEGNLDAVSLFITRNHEEEDCDGQWLKDVVCKGNVDTDSFIFWLSLYNQKKVGIDGLELEESLIELMTDEKEVQLKEAMILHLQKSL